MSQLQVNRINDASGGVLAPISSVMRNRLIDAGFTINQRGYVSGTALASGVYAHDRWKAGASGCTYTFTQGSTGVPIVITITAGSLQQVIEGANMPEGGTYVLSWTGTAQARFNGGTYSNSPLSVTGITAGANTTIEFSTGTCSFPQLERGTQATSFEYRQYGQELALCQRYLPAFTFEAGEKFITGQAISTSIVVASLPFPATARAVATGITASAASSFALADAGLNYGANQTGTAIAFESGGVNSGTVRFTCTSGLVAGNASTILSRFANTKILFTGCEL